MEISADTAKLDEIKEIKAWKMLDHVTTNPSLIKKAGAGSKEELERHIEEICKLVGNNGTVSLEVISLDSAGMVREAEILYDKFNWVANNIAIKIPIFTSTEFGKANEEGLKTIKELHEKGMRVNTTLIFTPEQALLAAEAGADFVSPFLGRVDDYLRTEKLGWRKVKENPKENEFLKSTYYPATGIKEINDGGIVSGVHLCKVIVDLLKDYKTRVIAASLRNRRQVTEAMAVGADIATIPYPVIKEIREKGFEKLNLELPDYNPMGKERFYHPKTVEGIINFSKDVTPEYRELFNK